MIRRLLAFLTAAALLLTGCWSRREVNDLGAVTTLGIDQLENGKMEVIMGIPLPAGAPTGGKGQASTARRGRVILRREGATIGEAIRMAELASPRRIGLDHSQIVLFGERFARNGVNSLLDYLLRSPQVRLSARVLLVEGATPAELMETEPLMRPTHAESLRELLSTRAGLTMTLKEFFIARSTNYTSPIIPIIRVEPHPTSEEGVGANELELAGAAVFKGDRAAVFLDQSSVRAAVWLIAEARDAIITAPCPAGGPGMVSAKVARAGRSIKPVWDGRRLSFDVTLSGEVSLTDLQCHLNLVDPEALVSIQTALKKDLTGRIAGALRDLQANEVDPYGFGELVRAQFPALWRQVGEERWLKTWATVPIRVHPDVTVVHLNMTSAPPILSPSAGN